VHLKRVLLFPEQYPVRDRYPFSLDIFHEMRSLEFLSPVTFFTGENGTGKSTLLEAIARRCSIHIWQNTDRRRFEHNPYEEEFYRFIDIEWTNGIVQGSFFASAIFHDFARFLDEWASASPEILNYFGGKSLMTQSHGQSLMSYFRSRFKIKGLYFLDEPETALSPKRQIELIDLLQDTGKAGHAQFIIATHSPIILSCPGATIYSFDHVPVRRVDYEETELYKVYKEFFKKKRN
jgi:predicted ATPase